MSRNDVNEDGVEGDVSGLRDFLCHNINLLFRHVCRDTTHLGVVITLAMSSLFLSALDLTSALRGRCANDDQSLFLFPSVEKYRPFNVDDLDFLNPRVNDKLGFRGAV